MQSMHLRKAEDAGIRMRVVGLSAGFEVEQHAAAFYFGDEALGEAVVIGAHYQAVQVAVADVHNVLCGIASYFNWGMMAHLHGAAVLD